LNPGLPNDAPSLYPLLRLSPPVILQVVIGKLRSDTSTTDSHHLQHLKAAKALLVSSSLARLENKCIFYHHRQIL
jgi:hypothetical protein